MSKSSRKRGPAWSWRSAVGDARRHPGRAQATRSTSFGASSQSRTKTSHSGSDVGDARRDAGLGRGDRVVELVPAIDGEQLRVDAPGIRTK